jgi:hypothetical protein
MNIALKQYYLQQMKQYRFRAALSTMKNTEHVCKSAVVSKHSKSVLARIHKQPVSFRMLQLVLFRVLQPVLFE